MGDDRVVLNAEKKPQFTTLPPAAQGATSNRFGSIRAGSPCFQPFFRDQSIVVSTLRR